MLIKKSTRHMRGPALAALIRQVHQKSIPAVIRVRGGSMAPIIRPGDFVAITPATPPYRFGDIVAFLSPETRKLVIHRIIGRSRNRLIIKGDNVPDRQDVIHFSHIIGTVTGYGTTPAIARKTGPGWEKIPVAMFSRLKISHRVGFLFKNLLK